MTAISAATPGSTPSTIAPPSSMTNHGSTPRSRRIATASLAARPDTSSLQPKESQTSRPGTAPSAMRSSTA